MADNIVTEDDLPVENVRPTHGMTVKVFKGSFWVLTGQVLPLIATFIATPFVIRYLGSESYGVLILVGLVSGYFSYADFGMSLASTKFGSHAYAEHSREKEGLYVRTAAYIAFLSSLVIALPMFFFSGWIVGDLLKVPVHLYSQASVALKITSAAFLLSVISGVVNTPQLSRMRMDLNVLINAGSKILMILITPVVLYFGGGIVEATIVAFGAALAILLGNIFVSGRLLPELYKPTISNAFIKPLMKFGGNVVLYGIGLLITNNLEKLLLPRLVSVQSLAYYSIAFTFANMTTMFSMAMVQTLIPAFSQLLAPDKKIQLNTLFSRSVRISLIGLVPSIMVLLVIAKPFFTIWAGKEFGIESVYPFYILLVGVFFGILVYIPNCVLLSSGRPDIFARFYLIEIIPYAALAFFLVSRFGILGAATAWSIREIVNALIFIWLAKKYTGVSFNLRGYLDGFIFGFLVFIPVVLFALFYNNFSLWLILMLPISLVAYSLITWVRLTNLEEKVWIRSKINRFLKK